MGEFWFREGSEVVIEGDFDGFVGPKAVGLSGGQFDFVVQTLDGAGRNSALRTEPVENQLSMVAQGLGDLFHGLNPRSHRAETPLVKELRGPAWADVLPESLKVLAQQMTANRLQVVLEQFG